MGHLARAIDELGRHEEALGLYDHTLELFEAAYEPGSWRIAHTLIGRGLSLLALGRSLEAQADIEAGHEVLAGTFAPDDGRVLRAVRATERAAAAVDL